MHSYVGKEGLKARQYHAQRAATVQRVLDAAMVSAAQSCRTPVIQCATSIRGWAFVIAAQESSC